MSYIYLLIADLEMVKKSNRNSTVQLLEIWYCLRNDYNWLKKREKINQFFVAGIFNYYELPCYKRM